MGPSPSWLPDWPSGPVTSTTAISSPPPLLEIELQPVEPLNCQFQSPSRSQTDLSSSRHLACFRGAFCLRTSYLGHPRRPFRLLPGSYLGHPRRPFCRITLGGGESAGPAAGPRMVDYLSPFPRLQTRDIRIDRPSIDDGSDVRRVSPPGRLCISRYISKRGKVIGSTTLCVMDY